MAGPAGEDLVLSTTEFGEVYSFCIGNSAATAAVIIIPGVDGWNSENTRRWVRSFAATDSDQAFYFCCPDICRGNYFCEGEDFFAKLVDGVANCLRGRGARTVSIVGMFWGGKHALALAQREGAPYASIVIFCATDKGWDISQAKVPTMLLLGEGTKSLPMAVRTQSGVPAQMRVIQWLGQVVPGQDGQPGSHLPQGFGETVSWIRHYGTQQAATQ
mmetsp:Transcript_9754/g.31983  ORF Transcript_9754/g.31983 Transcript_9754/m.31983 type:complete len:216 (+) Transcript_9754:87-734(+)